MTSRLICASIVAVVSFAGLAISGSFTSQNDDASLDKRIHTLLVERRDTLRQRSAALDERFTQGRVVFESVLFARNDLLDAELELASSKAERIAAHEKRLDNYRELEKLMMARHAVGASTTEDGLMAKAARLRAEIELLREQMRPE